MTKILFTDDQEKALKAIKSFLKNKRKHEFTLSGYAGVGKTTLISHIIEIARGSSMPAILCAPTNKAADVLKQKTKLSSCSTVHKTIYNVDKRGRMHLKNTSKHIGGLIICDEASMLDDGLIKDLREFAAKFRHKILYVGDNFQLPPVNKSKFTVFDLPEKDKITMTHICRQEEDSSIILYATALREVGRDAFIPSSSLGDIIVDKEANIWKEYIKSLQNNEDSTLIVWRNVERIKYNLKARAMLKHSGNISAGEPLMVISNSTHYNNGEVFHLNEKFTHLSNTKITYSDGYAYGRYGSCISINEANAELILTETGVPILFFPRFEKPSLYHTQVRASEIDKILPENIKSYFIEENKKGRLSLNRNVVIATYGYAITAHKAQGSQWDNVFIEEACRFASNSITPEKREEEARWLYTAITRASKKLYLSSSIATSYEWNKITLKAKDYM